MNTLNPDDVFIVLPDQKLKKKVGMDLAFALSSEKLKRVDAAIAENNNTFIEEALRDLHHLDAMLRDLPNSGKPEVLAQIMREVAFSIKSRGGLFGYGLASKIGKSLYDYMEPLNALEEAHLTVIRPHVDALRAVFAQNMTGDGAEFGQELLNTLGALRAKFSV